MPGLPCGWTSEPVELQEMADFSLADLEDIVARRAMAPVDESWTAKLVSAGRERALKKFGEEAIETTIAAISEDNESLTAETADLLYHLLVVLYIAGVSMADVMAELERRTTRSGLQEKAGRTA